MKFFLLLTVFFTVPTLAQENSNSLYKAFDNIVGLKNTDLSYGTLYTEKYRTLEDNHPFLDQSNFVIGNVKYQNQVFFDVFMKYDIAEDHLILNLSSTFENRSIILEKSFVTSFTIANKSFFKVKEYGFCEVLQKANAIELFKKNVKEKKKKLNTSFVYYKFLENNYYLLKYNDAYYKVENKKDFYNIFPSSKNIIATFYKENKNLRKTNLDQFYSLLAISISTNSTDK
jgi:hypothetical protein